MLKSLVKYRHFGLTFALHPPAKALAQNEDILRQVIVKSTTVVHLATIFHFVNPVPVKY
jgi:hypothetical protein